MKACKQYNSEIFLLICKQYNFESFCVVLFLLICEIEGLRAIQLWDIYIYAIMQSIFGALYDITLHRYMVQRLGNLGTLQHLLNFSLNVLNPMMFFVFSLQKEKKCYKEPPLEQPNPKESKRKKILEAIKGRTQN